MGQTGSSRTTGTSTPISNSSSVRPRAKSNHPQGPIRQHTVDVASIGKREEPPPPSPVFGSPLDDNEFFITKSGSDASKQDVIVAEQEETKLPTVFRWPAGGDNVSIAGTFSNWNKIPMVKSHGDFVTILDIPEGEHQYKFCIDGKWQHDDSQPVTPDPYGGVNNSVAVKKSDFDLESIESDSSRQSSSPPGNYVSEIPGNLQGIHSTPPVLPAHLHYVLLNQDPPSGGEPTILPEPNHVSLNHMYALSIKDGVLVLAATHRYKKKYVTTLLYRPL